MKSDIADVKNAGGRPAGSISAGWFLREFVDGFPWAHLDIAGTAYTEREDATASKGPDGNRRAAVHRIRVGQKAVKTAGKGRRAKGKGDGLEGTPARLLVRRSPFRRSPFPFPRNAARPGSRRHSFNGLSRPRHGRLYRAIPRSPAGGAGSGAGAPAPRRSRSPPGAHPKTIFTRDSIEWGHAATVGDLLSQIPGVYLWRGGFTGRPGTGQLRRTGRNVGRVLSGRPPYVAAGIDSVAVDPALFSISFLDRIEVERWPGLLRVSLFTATARPARAAITHRHCEGRPELRALRGRPRAPVSLRARLFPRRRLPRLADRERHEQQLLQHAGVGPGQLHPVGHIRGAVPAHPLAAQSARVRHLRPDPRRHDRPRLQGHAHRRAVAPLAAFARGRPGTGARPGVRPLGMGWRADSISRSTRSAGMSPTAPPTFSIGGSAFHRTRWTALDTRATPDGRRRLLQRERRGGSSASLRRPGSDYVLARRRAPAVEGLALTGSARVGNMVAAPSITTDTAQQLRDFECNARVGPLAARPPGRLVAHVGVQPVRLCRVSRRWSRSPLARRRLAHGRCSGRAAAMGHARELVQ